MTTCKETVINEIRLHDAFVVNWLRTFLGDAETAADIKQAAIVKVLEYAADNAIDNPKALIFRIARNLAINELRRRKRFNATFVNTSDYSEEDSIAAISADTPDPEQTISYKNELGRLVNAIQNLPDKQKKTVILGRIHGLENRKIAETLEVSESSVEKYMRVALKTIRTEVDC
ncbi:MAG: RNA polymerase sigma factor [Hyphococcus sp.]